MISPGLAARLQTGDFATRLEEVSPAVPLTDQLVLIPSGDPFAVRVLRVVNPSDSFTAVNVTVFDSQGNVAERFSAALEAFCGYRPHPGGASFRGRQQESVRAKPVVAQLEVRTDDSLMLLVGQAATGLSRLRLELHLMLVIGNGFESTLILSNPTGQSITVFRDLVQSDPAGPVRIFPRIDQPQAFPDDSGQRIGFNRLPGNSTGLLFVPAGEPAGSKSNPRTFRWRAH